MQPVIKTRGLKEMERDFKKLSKSLQKELQLELRKLAEPAAQKISGQAARHRFSSPTVAGIRAGSRVGIAVVRQSRRKKTGHRPDFGGIQMRYAFLPGADEAEPEVLAGVEYWLDRVTAEGGLGVGGVL